MTLKFSAISFLRDAATLVFALTTTFNALASEEKSGNRPNILFIMTDQQSAHMMSCTGNTTLNTPALDGLAASGIRFERAYATNPVCAPSRFSLQTGRMPSAIGMKWNHPADVPQDITEHSLGRLFQGAGYETVYGGKVHLPGALNKIEKNGYRRLTPNSRQGLADACAEFIKGPHEKPFFLFASFMNPHDICYVAINDALRAEGKAPVNNIDSKTAEAVANEARKIANTSDDAERLFAPLPANHAISESEPEAISTEYLPQAYSGAQYRRRAREEWTEREWKIFRHTYRRLTEMADKQIGQILDALREAGLEENTLIVFTSDHGDMDGAHKLEHKSVLYEDSARIPFILSPKGVIPSGVVDDTHLVSNGLDLLPTLCDAANIKTPEGLHSLSLMPLAKNVTDVPWRNHPVVESLHGRMLRTDRYKYSIYASGKNREQLVDLNDDPGEMRNLADEKDYKEILDKHRQLLGAWVKTTDDVIAPEYLYGAMHSPL